MALRIRVLICLFVLIAGFPSQGAPKATLDDLKKLPITCLVPTWLPDGYRLLSMEIARTDREGLKDPKAPAFPTYSLEYGNGKKGSFTIESARWGIGDRNLDTDDNAEESAFDTADFGKIYIIYVPKGKAGIKKRITANWIADAAWKAEEKAKKSLPQMGRVHGISGFGMTLAEFEKIARSLRPVKREK